MTKSLPVAQIANHPTEISDDWSRYWSYVKAVQQKGPQGYLESLYYLSIMQTYETSPARQQLLSNYLMMTLLPAISAYFPSAMQCSDSFSPPRFFRTHSA